MHSLILSFVLSVAVAHQAMALTYWIDQSCTGKRSMDAAVKETISMGSRASSRLNAASDTDFQHVYEFLMKRKKSDAAQFQTIEGFMSDVGQMTSADQKSANIRIYCDEDRRWKPRIDPKTQQKTGGWEDPDNWIQYQGLSVYSNPGCLDTRGGRKFTYAQTYKVYMAGDLPEQQADLRAAITICDYTHFSDPDAKLERKGKLLQDLKDNADLTRATKGIESFQQHVSKILLHEVSHFASYGTIDNAYFWKENLSGPTIPPTIRDLSADDLMKNADVRAYLGQLALIADRGFTIQRPPPDSASQAVKDDYNTNVTNGKLFKYNNLTKRTLQRRMARLARRYLKAEAQISKS